MCFDCLNLCVRFLDTHLHNLSKVRILMIPARTAIPPDRLSNHETKLILGQFACPIRNKTDAGITLRDLYYCKNCMIIVRKLKTLIES